MKNKWIKIIFVLLVFLFGLPGCRAKKKDNTLTSLLLLSALTGSASSGPKYEFSETTTSANALAGSDYFGAGIAGYTIPDVTFSGTGPSNPTAIVQVEQNQTSGGVGFYSIRRGLVVLYTKQHWGTDCDCHALVWKQ